jgi:Tol biopolymer transport system component
MVSLSTVREVFGGTADFLNAQNDFLLFPTHSRPHFPRRFSLFLSRHIMRTRLRFLMLAGSAVFTLALAPAALLADPVSTIRGEIRARRIAVESDTPALAALARKAFAAHGGYELSSAAPNVPLLRLAKIGDSAVSLVLKTGGSQITQDVTGATWREAALRACDAVLVRDGHRPFLSGQIAFVSDRTGKKEVHAGDLFLDEVRPLTNYGSICVSPRWTGDGREILHTTYVNGNFTDIYAVNASTGARRGVIVGARGSSIGAVSNPRTGQIAFASSSLGDMDIFLADATGRNARRFIATTKGVETDPAWSADGTKLAFTGGPAGRPNIHVAEVPGSGTSRRINTGFNYATEPSWNPVFPEKIAFTYQSGGFHLGIVDTRTGAVEKIKTKPAGNYTHPVWCADGRHIVAVKIAGKSSRLVLIDTKTGVAGKPNPNGEKVTVLSGPQMSNCFDPDYYAGEHARR